jgi:hypothetical protein
LAPTVIDVTYFDEIWAAAGKPAVWLSGGSVPVAV